MVVAAPPKQSKKIDAFFQYVFDNKASDLHLSSGKPPMVRVCGELEPIAQLPQFQHEDVLELLQEIAPPAKWDQFCKTGDVDFGYEIPGLARFRCNFFNQRSGCAAVFRQ